MSRPNPATASTDADRHGTPATAAPPPAGDETATGDRVAFVQVHASHDPEPAGVRLYPGGLSCRRCRHFVAFETAITAVTRRGEQPCQPAPAELTTTPPVRRMRIRRGRVMHIVEPTGQRWLQSQCRRRDRYGHTRPRAVGPTGDWSDEQHWYPNCKHCPAHQPPTREDPS